jgi:hypothetical protein
MREKHFLARKKHQKRRKRAKEKARRFEQGKLKFEELPRLAREMLARKRRFERRTAA